MWFKANVRSSPSAVSDRLPKSAPALFTSTCSAPKRLPNSAAARRASVTSSRFAWMVSTPKSRRTASSLPASRPTTTTRAPIRASSRAVTRPMPDVPPVTSTVLPFIRRLSAPAPRAIHLALRLALRDVLALVHARLSLAYAELDLHPPVLEVKAQRNERIARLLLRFLELVDLAAVQEQLARALRVVVQERPGGLVGRDLRIVEPELAALGKRIGIGELRARSPQALHLRAGERDAAFELALDVVVEAGAAVGGDDLEVLCAHP